MLKEILAAGLLWTGGDNGADIAQDQAAKWCAEMKGGWRLPAIGELEALSEAERNRFRLSAGWVWSSDKVAAAEDPEDELSWGLAMANGRRTQDLREAIYGSRALCVKPATGPTLPETTTLTVDPEHTAVAFSWSHMGYSNPVARLEQVTGTVTVNEADPARSKVEVTMSLDGLRTGSAALDHRLKGKEFFDQEHFPDVTFVSTRVEKTGGESFKLYGNLTAHGVTKAVVLDARVNKYGEHPLAHTLIGEFEAETLLRRSDFGMAKFAPAVSDELRVHITVEVVPAS